MLGGVRAGLGLVWDNLVWVAFIQDKLSLLPYEADLLVWRG